MPIRTQLCRRIWSNYGGRSHHPRLGTPLRRRVDSGTLSIGVGAAMWQISNFKKVRNDFTNTGFGIRRNIPFSRKVFSTLTPVSPKSTRPEVSPEQNSREGSVENILKRFLRTGPPPTSLYGAVKSTQDGRKSLCWQSLCYSAGAVALAIFASAMAGLNYEEGIPTRRHAAFISTWSILWDSVVEFKEKMGMLLSDVVNDVVEAGESTTIMARCLISVLLTVSEESTTGINGWLIPGVAALVADLSAHKNRRKAVVEAGGGCVIDWLLKRVSAGDCPVTQAETSRALAHLLSDENTCEVVLSRPHALPSLFQFASTLRQNKGFQDWSGGQEFPVDSEGPSGKSMLVTAIMDLITSSCDTEDGNGVVPKLPCNADPGDIAAALKVIKDGGWLLDDQDQQDGDSAGKADKDSGGVHAIGIRVLGGTGIVGIQRIHPGYFLYDLFASNFSDRFIQNVRFFWSQEGILINPHSGAHQPFNGIGTRQAWTSERIASAECIRTKCGLWDDLQGRHITVPLAAWALAMWAQASSINRFKIAELDGNGDALLLAVLAPEKTVKWHGAMAMRLLLGSRSYSNSDVPARWSCALLNVATQAGRLKDTSLAHSALVTLTGCISQSKTAHGLLLREGLPIMREIATESDASPHIQGALSQVLYVLIGDGGCLPIEENKKWAAILLRWVCNPASDNLTRSCGSRVLVHVVNSLGLGGIPVSQAWLAMLLMEVLGDRKIGSMKGKWSANMTSEAREREQLENQVIQGGIVAAAELAKVVAQEAAHVVGVSETEMVGESAAELLRIDVLGLDVMGNSFTRETLPKVTAIEAAEAVRKALKALTELVAEDPVRRQRILEAGGLCLLRRFLLYNDYGQWATFEASEALSRIFLVENEGEVSQGRKDDLNIQLSVSGHMRKQAARLLSVLTLQPAASFVIAGDRTWYTWLESCADGKIAGSSDLKTRSYALTSLLNVSSAQSHMMNSTVQHTNYIGKARETSENDIIKNFWPCYEDEIFIMNPKSDMWKNKMIFKYEDQHEDEAYKSEDDSRLSVDSACAGHFGKGKVGLSGDKSDIFQEEIVNKEPVMDVIFIHGLRGGPFKTWRVADSKTTTRTPLADRIDVEAGEKEVCWPQEWLADDLPQSRLLSVKYKTNLSKWSGVTLPLQEVSSMLLDKLLAAGVGERPLVFVTHSMGGLVVKQMLLQAGGDETRAHLANHTTGIVFYSCPHFGSKLADMPWRIGYVLRPAPSIGELRSGSPRLEELNLYLRQLHKDGHLDVLSFSETKVTPLVEGYGGWGLRLEVVPIESAYPGFGELVVLPGTDHVNSCKPLNREDPAYTKTLEFLQNLEAHHVRVAQKK